MPSTFTSNTGIEKIADGEQTGLWGQTTNLNLDIIDRSLNGSTSISLSGTTHTLTTSNGLLSDGQFAVLLFAGSPSGTNTVTIAPNTAQKLYFVRNTTAETVILSQGSGATVSVLPGTSRVVFTDGAGAGAAVFDITNTLAMGSVAITGGSINGTTVGATSASTGAFTTLTSSGTTTLNGTTIPASKTLVDTDSAQTLTNKTISGSNNTLSNIANASLTNSSITFGSTAQALGSTVSALNGVTIGATTASTGAFTTLSASTSLTTPLVTNAGTVALSATGANVITASTNGAERLRIDSAGNVGVGPVPSVFTQGRAIELFQKGYGFWNGTSSIYSIANTFFDGGFKYADTGEASNYFQFQGQHVWSTAPSGTAGNAITFSERMRIDSAGNVGIGTSSPTNRLTVNSGAATTTAQFTSTGSSVFLGMTNSGSTAFIGAESSGAFVVQTPGSGFSTKMLIDSAGNVGIGTSSPQALLDVVGSGAPTRANVFAMARIAGGNSVANDLQLYGPNTSQVRINFGDPESENVGDISYNHSSNSMRFVTNASERLRIDSAGNVGIGTTAPTNLLTVSGTGAAMDITDTTRNLRAGVSAAGTTFGYLTMTTNHALTFGTNNTERARIDASGNLLVGTTTTIDGGKLVVSGGQIWHLGNQLNVRPSSGVQYELVNRDGAGFDFYVNNATNLAARIDSSGNVGIGTGSPQAYTGFTVLTVDNATNGGVVSIRRNNTVFLNLYNETNFGVVEGVGGSTGLIFKAGDAERARIDASGNFLVGKTTIDFGIQGSRLTPNGEIIGTLDNGNVLYLNRLSSNGNICEFSRSTAFVGSISVTTTNTAYNTSSDYRLKEDVQPMVGSVDRLMALKPVNFAWKVDGSRVDGFLAHEAQQVVPECVTGEKDAVDKDGKPQYQGIDQSKIVPLLTAALQEALKRIEALEAQINS